MDSFTSIVHRASPLLAVIGSVCMVAVMVTIVSNVILRFFGESILGTFEIVELLIVVMVAFALGYTAIKQGHVAVTIITSRLSQPVRTIFAIITTFLSLGIWGLIIWQGTEFAWVKWLVPEVTYLLRWPVPPFRFAFVLGAIILFLVLLTDLFRTLREASRK